MIIITTTWTYLDYHLRSVHASENIILQTFLVSNKCKGTIKIIINVTYVHKIHKKSHVHNITDILCNVYLISVKKFLSVST